MSGFLKSLFTPEPGLPVKEMGSFKNIFWNYILVVLYFIAGTILPFSFFSVYAWVTINYIPELKYLIPKSDALFQALLAASSFLFGFGAAALRIHLMLKASGRSLRDTLAINLDAFQGRLLPALKWAAIALLTGIGLEAAVSLMLPFKADDSAANFIMSISDNVYALTILLMVVIFGAGFFEELVFRGFVFNSLRERFRGEKAMLFFKNRHLADYAAVSLSALIFAVVHMTPTAIPGIFVLGFVLGELYRRTGSLIPSMLMHAGNNFIAVLILLNSMS